MPRNAALAQAAFSDEQRIGFSNALFSPNRPRARLWITH